MVEEFEIVKVDAWKQRKWINDNINPNSGFLTKDVTFSLQIRFKIYVVMSGTAEDILFCRAGHYWKSIEKLALIVDS